MGRKGGRGLCTDMTNVHSVNVVNFKYSWKIIINYGAVKLLSINCDPSLEKARVVIVAAPWW